ADRGPSDAGCPATLRREPGPPTAGTCARSFSPWPRPPARRDRTARTRAARSSVYDRPRPAPRGARARAGRAARLSSAEDRPCARARARLRSCDELEVVAEVGLAADLSDFLELALGGEHDVAHADRLVLGLRQERRGDGHVPDIP